MAMYIYDQKQLTEWLKIANDLIFEYMKKGDTITRTVDCKNVKTNDLIDRKSALDIFIEGDGDDDFTTGYNWAVDEYREKISQLPSVNKKTLTNADKIRNMTDEELEDFLNTIIYNCKCCDCRCSDCPVSGYEDTDGVCDMAEFLKRSVNSG